MLLLHSIVKILFGYTKLIPNMRGSLSVLTRSDRAQMATRKSLEAVEREFVVLEFLSLHANKVVIYISMKLLFLLFNQNPKTLLAKRFSYEFLTIFYDYSFSRMA